MRSFITGATGYIGLNLAHRLAENGEQVHALCYEAELAHLFDHPNITVYHGSILDPGSLARAMEGCTQVYHLAGYARKWAKSPRLFFEVNVQGTLNVLETAIAAGVQRVVVTSTAGVFGPSGDGVVTEESARSVPFFYAYESSKFEAERKVHGFVKAGLDVVIVNPTRVYGPGLLSESNAGTKVMKDYVAGKWHFIPGNGRRVGNYVYIDDVVQGHILAMERGTKGEKYILGGTNASYNEFFDLLKELSRKRFWMRKVPVWLMLFLSKIQSGIARIFGKSPVAPPYLVRKFTYDWRLSSDKARRDLGYRITPLREGMRQTLEWLQGAEQVVVED
ncbi:MAG: SDR family oxidoreductase [Bacteroidota bacterium]